MNIEIEKWISVVVAAINAEGLFRQTCLALVVSGQTTPG